MATLAADKSRSYANWNDQDVTELPMIAADIIYQGALVGDNASGLCRPLVAADPFLGINVFNQVDNSAGAASAKSVKLLTQGKLMRATVVGASAVTDVGDIVYAADDDTLTKASTGNSAIGRITKWHVGTTCDVQFQALLSRDPA